MEPPRISESEPPEGRITSLSELRHEALNLLMVIELACENLLEENPGSGSLREDVQQIAEAKRRLVKLLEETRGTRVQLSDQTSPR